MLRRFLRLTLVCLLAIGVLTRSTLPKGDPIERVRAFTRNIEFDFVAWMLDALGLKLGQSAIAAEDYLTGPQRRQLTLDFLKLVVQIQQKEGELAAIYANPEIGDPEAASQNLRQELDELYAQRDRIGPLAEAGLQDQIAATVSELGLTMGGQPIPPVLYHSTPLPTALIVSPRTEIRQEADISLDPGLTVDERAALEEQVDRALDVSSLVVGIGGVGVYPTMVMQTSDLEWLAEVVAHEWIHNYLTLRPLGASYLNSPELRIMNETTASIAGIEIGRALMEKYYPELLPPPPPPEAPSVSPQPTPAPPAFDFREEMHTTRVRVDELLAQGKVEEAEQYMEERRIFFWENGYQIRKLNQAYFAFYGAYADQPGGAAGADPVGAAVRALRAQSSSLSDFIDRIAWMSSFEQLQRAVEAG
jgi:hypothetical protein